MNLLILCHNSYIFSLFNFDDLTQEHFDVKRVDHVYFVCFHCQHVFNFLILSCFSVFAYFLFAGSYHCCNSSGIFNYKLSWLIGKMSLCGQVDKRVDSRSRGRSSSSSSDE